MFTAWDLVFAGLIIELAFTVWLLLDFLPPIRRLVIAFLRYSFGSRGAKIFLLIIAFILLVLIVTNYNEQQKLYEQIKETKLLADVDKELSLRIRQFRDQRNLYLCFFTLFHMGYLWRLTKLHKGWDDEITQAKAKVAYSK